MTQFNFSATSSLIPIGNGQFKWRLDLSQDQCSIFAYPLQDPDIRFESPTFNMDLKCEGRTTSVALSLVMGPALTGQIGVHTSTTCCRCSYIPNSEPRTTQGPALFLRNLSDENIDLANAVVKRKVWNQTGQQIVLYKTDENKSKISLKRHGQKLVHSYQDLRPLSSVLSDRSYPGDFVIFEFDLNMEVFKLVAK